MRRGSIAFVLLTAAVSPCGAQTPQDTVVTVYGFLQTGDSGRWSLLLPQPVLAAGRRIGLLAAPDAARWPTRSSTYGRWSPPAHNEPRSSFPSRNWRS